MKIAVAIALGAGLAAAAMSPSTASAQQIEYAPSEHRDYRAEDHGYRPDQGYEHDGAHYDGRDRAADYGSRLYDGGGRYEQRELRGDERGYADGRYYGDERGYDGGRYVEGGYGAGYGDNGYRLPDYGYGYGRRVYREGYGYGGGYADEGYDHAYDYESPSYGAGGYDRYTGFSAPPVNWRDVRRQERELAPAYRYRYRGYACGCGW